MTAFAGHSTNSVAKQTYNNPTAVAPADRIYAADGADADSLPDTYNWKAFTSQPGESARESGYPQA